MQGREVSPPKIRVLLKIYINKCPWQECWHWFSHSQGSWGLERLNNLSRSKSKSEVEMEQKWRQIHHLCATQRMVCGPTVSHHLGNGGSQVPPQVCWVRICILTSFEWFPCTLQCKKQCWIACIAGGFLYYWATSTVQLWGQAQWQILNVHPHLLLPSPSLICVCVQMYVHTHSHTLFHEPFDSKLQTLYPFISKYVSMYFL